MYKEIGVTEYAEEVLQNLSTGVFLTTFHKGVLNTMTIGWGGVTVVWGRPIFMVLVRDSRATYELLEGSMEFTISIPIINKMTKELSFCGTKSLREFNKFKELGLTPLKGRKIDTPVIKEAGLHYECKVLYKQKLNQVDVNRIVKDKYYNPQSTNHAIHTVYFGEIVDHYIYKEEK